ncbi:right-handed parallel beta-helix repeat-containing protein [Porticoccaceae bacterium]|nr:right-handed parallel beta-helix repeat-containing protein [Porticoccaceae bacterium]
MNNKFRIVLIIVIFAGGWILGSNNNVAPTITSSVGGASYSGGYQATDTDAKLTVGAVPLRETQGNVHIVKPGDSIQAAVEAAQPGDTIQVMPGIYSETVYIDKDDIHLVGVIQNGARATMDGLSKLNDAILYSGNNIIIENFRITKYKGNGIMGQAGNNFEIRNNVIVDTGIYGIFPQLGTNGLIEHNVVSGIEDAAIYIGMSDNIHVAYNEVFDSVAGIEIENSRHAIVEYNNAHHNTGGILAFVTPGLPIKTTEDVIIRNNFVSDNNTPNFGAPGSIVSGIPAGTGILVMAADDVIIEGNIISNNKTAGIIINDHSFATTITMDIESDPNSDRTMILDNVMLNNGYDTIPEVMAVALTELHTGLVDIVHVGPSNGSCIINRHRYRTVGIGSYGECDFTNTDSIDSYLLAGGAEPRVIHPSERGEIAYLGVCSGCHSYTGRLIGPSVEVIQAMYAGNPEGLVEYINAPIKKRDNFPPMPAQNYLDAETQMAVATYMLALEK